MNSKTATVMTWHPQRPYQLKSDCEENWDSSEETKLHNSWSNKCNIQLHVSHPFPHFFFTDANIGHKCWSGAKSTLKSVTTVMQCTVHQNHLNASIGAALCTQGRQTRHQSNYWQELHKTSTKVMILINNSEVNWRANVWCPQTIHIRELY